jgi:hypothetical protein
VFELVDHLCPEIVDPRIEPRNILLRRHMLNDMREHLPHFGERRLVCLMGVIVPRRRLFLRPPELPSQVPLPCGRIRRSVVRSLRC